jgi:hypothetical protein
MKPRTPSSPPEQPTITLPSATSGANDMLTVCVVLDLGVPQLLAGLGVEGNEHQIGCGEIDLVAKQSDPAAGRVEQQNVLGDRPFEPPQEIAVFGVYCLVRRL